MEGFSDNKIRRNLGVLLCIALVFVSCFSSWGQMHAEDITGGAPKELADEAVPAGDAQEDVICPLPSEVDTDADYSEVFDMDGNLNAQNYVRWSSPVYSYMYPIAEGFLKVSASNSGIKTEKLDSSLSVIDGSSKDIEPPLPIFGGFYTDGIYYYGFFGQTQKEISEGKYEEDNEREIIRVVKYDSSLTELAHASLSNINTVIPFKSGSLRVAFSGKYMYVRTAHRMYRAEDNQNHQACMTFNIDTDTMTLKDSQTSESMQSKGYISHSFDQYIMVDDEGYIVTLDHGDAYPRAAVLGRYVTVAGIPRFIDGGYTYNEFLPIMGEDTRASGVGLGALSYSKDNYIIAGSSVPQDETWTEANEYRGRNVFVAFVARGDDIGSSEVKIKWYTDYELGGNTSASVPQLVKLSEDRFMLLWNVLNNSNSTTRATGRLNYVFIDGNGEQIGEKGTVTGYVTDCVPVLNGNDVVWYYNDGEWDELLTVTVPDEVLKGKTGDDSSSAYEGSSSSSSSSSSAKDDSSSSSQSSSDKDPSGSSSSGGSSSGDGNSTSGNSASGNSTSGNSTSGNSASGNSASGNSASGNSTSGNSASGNSASGNSASGNSAGGNSASGNSSGGGQDKDDSSSSASGGSDPGGKDSSSSSDGKDSSSSSSGGVPDKDSSSSSGGGVPDKDSSSSSGTGDTDKDSSTSSGKGGSSSAKGGSGSDKSSAGSSSEAGDKDSSSSTGIKEDDTPVTEADEKLRQKLLSISADVIDGRYYVVRGSKAFIDGAQKLKKDKNYRVEYSAKKTAKLNKKGVVAGKKVGEIKITVTSRGVTREYPVVIEEPQTVKKLYVNKGEGGSISVNNTRMKPKDFVSSRPDCVSVSDNGTVSANSGKNSSVTYMVGTKKYKTVVYVCDQKISGKDSLKVSGKLKLKLSGGAPGEVIWRSLNESVATVDKQGVVIGKKKGSVTVTAENNGRVVSKQLKVE